MPQFFRDFQAPVPDDILGYQTNCPACGHLNVRPPLYFWGPVFPHVCEWCFANLVTGEKRLRPRHAGPHRIEVDCPRCKQVNARFTGWRSFFNPRRASDCTLCGTSLQKEDLSESAVHGAIRKTHSVIMWSIIYFDHLVAAVGAFVIGGSIIALFLGKFAEMTERPLIGWSLIIIGGAAGIALAERRRRRGTLVGNRQS